MRRFVNTGPKCRAGFIRRRDKVAAKEALVEVCKEPSERQLGCICGDKQEAKQPFILASNENLLSRYN